MKCIFKGKVYEWSNKNWRLQRIITKKDYQLRAVFKENTERCQVFKVEMAYPSYAPQGTPSLLEITAKVLPKEKQGGGATGAPVGAFLRELKVSDDAPKHFSDFDYATLEKSIMDKISKTWPKIKIPIRDYKPAASWDDVKSPTFGLAYGTVTGRMSSGIEPEFKMHYMRKTRVTKWSGFFKKHYSEWKKKQTKECVCETQALIRQGCQCGGC